jgi:hypothetical protein
MEYNAETVPNRKKGIQLGAGIRDPLVNDAALASDDWIHADVPDKSCVLNPRASVSIGGPS